VSVGISDITYHTWVNPSLQQQFNIFNAVFQESAPINVVDVGTYYYGFYFDTQGA